MENKNHNRGQKAVVLSTMSKKEDPEYVTLKDCMSRHVGLENRITALEKTQIVEIVIMIAGFALTLLAIFGIKT